MEGYPLSLEVTTAFVREYNAGVRLLQQQIPSRLRDAVMLDADVEGDRAFFDQTDATVMNLVTNRHGDTEYTDTPHRRRMVTLATYEVADLVDRADRRRLLNDPINAYTDLLLHDMGAGLADGIAMSLASGREFRTAPLWGLRHHAPYLHDGRADTVEAAILAHGSELPAEPPPSEGQEARDNYNSLLAGDRAAVLTFLGTR